MKVTRGEMKRNAKASLKGRWGLAIGVTILFWVIVGVLSWLVQLPFHDELEYYANCIANGVSFEPDPAVMYGYEGLGLIMNIVLSPIYVGVALVFLRISRGQESRAGDMFTPISRFPKIAGLFLYVFIKTFLWTLLLIIPGIIAAYRYSQSFIIMAENPDIGIVAAVERSKQLMKGNKWRLFVLHLSFIGWAILACLTFGILLLWLNPYYMTTVSNFYNALLLERGTGLSLNNNGGGSQTQSGGFYDRGDDRNDGRGGDKNGGFANDEKDAFDRSGDYGRGGYYEDKDADEKNDW